MSQRTKQVYANLIGFLLKPLRVFRAIQAGNYVLVYCADKDAAYRTRVVMQRIPKLMFKKMYTEMQKGLEATLLAEKASK